MVHSEPNRSGFNKLTLKWVYKTFLVFLVLVSTYNLRGIFFRYMVDDSHNVSYCYNYMAGTELWMSAFLDMADDTDPEIIGIKERDEAWA